MSGTARTWVVTGANRGIGLELARGLQAAGEQVIATARRPDEAEALNALGVRVEALDVSEPDSVAAFARALGGAPVDALVNNAGVGVGSVPIDDFDVASMERFFAVNTMGPLRVTQALLPNLRAGGRKLVANVTSKMGSIADNTSGGAYAYRASKAALNMVTKSLAIDLGREGFVCLVLHPGWVKTDMGGASAPVEAGASAGGLLEVLRGAGPEANGRFFDFTGAEIPW